MQVIDQREFEKRSVLTGQKGTEQQFSVSDDPALMSMLSTGLYEYPLRTMIQEQLFNAWDAHRMGDCQDRPIDIYLNETSGMIVRDYGPGIAHDEITPIYCVYGASTKRDDPNQTGGFGLGCKAPFAYTDGFMVTSENQGRKDIYIAKRIGDSGGPSFTPVVQNQPTDESGLTVTIPLKEGDLTKAYAYVKDVLTLSGIKANIHMEDEDPEYIESKTVHKNGFVFDKHAPNRSIGVFALYGGVPYQIKPSDELSEEYTFFSNLIRHMGNLFIHFDPGTLTPLPSREGLNYSDKTVENINRKIEWIYEVFQEHLLPTVANCAVVLDQHIYDVFKDPSKNYSKILSSFMHRTDINVKNLWFFDEEEFYNRMQEIRPDTINEDMYLSIATILYSRSVIVMKLKDAHEYFKKKLISLAQSRGHSLNNYLLRQNLRDDDDLFHRSLILAQEAIENSIKKKSPIRFCTDIYESIWLSTTRYRHDRKRNVYGKEIKFYETYPNARKKVNRYPHPYRLFFTQKDSTPSSIHTDIVVLAKKVECLKLMDFDVVEHAINPNIELSFDGKNRLNNFLSQDKHSYRTSTFPAGFVVHDKKGAFEKAEQILQNQGFTVIRAPEPPLNIKKTKATTPDDFPVLKTVERYWGDETDRITDPDVWVWVTPTMIDKDRYAELPDRQIVRLIQSHYPKIVVLHNKRREGFLRKLGAMSYEEAAFKIAKNIITDDATLERYLIIKYLSNSLPSQEFLNSPEVISFLGLDPSIKWSLDETENREMLIAFLALHDSRIRGDYHRELTTLMSVVEKKNQALDLDTRFIMLENFEIFESSTFRSKLTKAPDKQAFIKKAIEFVTTI